MDCKERFESFGSGTRSASRRPAHVWAHLVTLIFVLCSTVSAQIPARSGGVGRGAGVPGQLTADAVALGPVEIGPPVKGAPYSAEALTEVVQVLMDGNRIIRRTSAMLYRDSRGWTRREVALGEIAGIVISGEPVRTITISDPDSGTTYVIDADNRVTALPRPERLGPGQPSSARGAPGPPQLPTPTRQRGALPNVTTKEESLGTRGFDGVVAEGTRRTLTIPAGAIGNERPIESVTERWFSPELQVVVMSRQRDPRFGETTYRLTNIVRTEPPATLFKVAF